jgi:hypothetical protein
MSRATLLLPLWAVRPVQSLSACTRVHFTFLLKLQQHMYALMPVFTALLFGLLRLISTFATNPSQFYHRLVRTLQTIYTVNNDAARPTGKDMRMHWFFYTPHDGLTCFYYNGVGRFTLARVAQCSQLLTSKVSQSTCRNIRLRILHVMTDI